MVKIRIKAMVRVRGKVIVRDGDTAEVCYRQERLIWDSIHNLEGIIGMRKVTFPVTMRRLGTLQNSGMLCVGSENGL